MQRVDAGYLYELGEAVRALKPFRLKNVPAYEIWAPLSRARQSLTVFFSQSVYSRTVRGVHAQNQVLIEAIDVLLNRIVSENLDTLTASDLHTLSEAYDRFEPAFTSALSMQVLYLVTPKGAYDVVILVEDGKSLFPESVTWKAPEAVRDIEQGSRALAFELWSAAAFHFHRANEAVLRRYFDLHMDPGSRKNRDTMGTMLHKLQGAKKGKQTVCVALQNIKEFHRNPNSHPGEFVDTPDQALDLVSAIRAAMGYMLDELEAAPFDQMMSASPNPDLNRNPLPPPMPAQQPEG